MLYDVLIAGCGPSGATLANILRLNGHKVAVFDRDEDIFTAPRAMTIDGESCRIFQSIGVQSRLDANDARPFLKHQFVDEKRKILCAFDFGSRDGDQGYAAAGVRFHQPALEAFLRADFAKNSAEKPDGCVDTYLGYEVESVDGEGEQASLSARNLSTGETETFQGQFIIGADGGGSKTRKYIGGNRVDFDYSRQWIVIDIVLHDKAAWDDIHEASEFMCRPNRAVVFVKGFHGHVRFDFEVDAEEAKTFSRQDALDLIGGYLDVREEDIEFQRQEPYHFYAGMPDQWRKGRVLIMGDAAHLTSPFSGQGLCMGIRDAANLGFKLDLILQGKANARLLDTYQSERWQHCEKIIAGASERGKMISASTRLDVFKRWLTFFIGRNFPQFAMDQMRKSSVAFGYEEGLVGDHTLAGHLFMQPLIANAGGEEMLMDKLTGNGFALLTLNDDLGANAAWFRDNLGGKTFVLGRDILDSRGALSAFFVQHEIGAILVRPDRYTFDAGPSGEALCGGLKHAIEALGPVAQPA